MFWWFLTFVIAAYIYMLIAVSEIIRFPLFSSKTKFWLCVFSLTIPILGAYISNRKINFKISEHGRADLMRELPFLTPLNVNPKKNDAEMDSDID